MLPDRIVHVPKIILPDRFVHVPKIMLPDRIVHVPKIETGRVTRSQIYTSKLALI